MKNWNPTVVLFISIFGYWPILFLMGGSAHFLNMDGSQDPLSILALGIDFFPFVNIGILLVVCKLWKEWAKRNKYILAPLFMFFVIFGVFILFFNHSAIG